MMRTLNNCALACALAFAVASAVPATAGAQGSQSGSQSGSGQTGGSSGGSSTGAGQTGGSTMGGTGHTGPGGQVGRDDGRNDLQKFVEKAAVSNMTEVQLGELAQQKAQNPEVKQFAQSMIDEHTKAQNELQQAAGAAGLTLPASLDEKHQKIHDKLSNMNGAEFDREYMKVMVQAHNDARKLLEKRVRKPNEPAAPAGGATDTGGGTAGTSGTSGTAGGSGGMTGSGSGAGASGTSGTSGGSGTTASGTSGSGSETGSSASGVVAASPSASAASIDSWAATTLPNVEHHLQMAKDLEKRVKDEGKSNNDKGDK